MYFFLLSPFLFRLAGNRRSKCHAERVADKSRGWLARTWETGGDLLGSRVCCGCGCLHAGVVFLSFFIPSHGRDGYATGSSIAIDLRDDGLGSE